MENFLQVFNSEEIRLFAERNEKFLSNFALIYWSFLQLSPVN